MTFHIPAGCTLTIDGPQFVTIGLTSHYAQTQGYAPVPVPTPAPTLVPHMAPQAVPQATPQATPSIPVYGFQPTYASWGAYAPAPDLGEGKVNKVKEAVEEIATEVEEVKTKFKTEPTGDVEAAFGKLVSLLADAKGALVGAPQKAKDKG